MEFKAPANHRPLFLLLRLLLLLILANIPFTMAQTYDGAAHMKRTPSIGHEDDPDDFDFTVLAPARNQDQTKTVNAGEHSVEKNNAQSLGYQSCPSTCECPLTLEPEAFKALKNNLVPVIRQRLMELLEKMRTFESAFEVVHTIDTLELLDESTSEFNVVRENMHNGAQRLRDAYHKLGKILQPQYVA
ncbi:hypothetical protein Vadar_011187 [Vaccinium darrowii]|uniref:Uncharacterized protein n=1 Tax=Vaccinium darrowii TaxID=229202 RepID=A0ACB7ZIW1_9ERIC|nr:hypothetical protein Vadar_011187 [Vaccinium darrowii]